MTRGPDGLGEGSNRPLDTHRGLDGAASTNRPGVRTPATLPPLVLEGADPRDLHGNIREPASERLKSASSSPGSGLWRLSKALP